MRRVALFALFAFTALLVACGGGAGSSHPSLPTNPGGPGAPTSTPTAAASASSGATATPTPVPSGSSRSTFSITEYATTVQAVSWTLGADGNPWFTGWSTSPSGNELYFAGNVNDGTGVTTAYPTPGNIESGPIISGPVNSLWFISCASGFPLSGSLVQVTLNGAMTTYSNYDPVCGEGIATDGTSIWVAAADENNVFYLLDFVPGETSRPASSCSTNSAVPDPMALGPDGAFWIADASSFEPAPVDRMTKTCVVRQASNDPSGRFDEITAGQGYLWAIDTDRNLIARLSTSGAETDYAIPSANGADGYIVAGPMQYVYFSEIKNAKIGRINTATGVVQEFTLQQNGSALNPGSITLDKSGNLWTNYNPYFDGGPESGPMLVLKITFPP